MFLVKNWACKSWILALFHPPLSLFLCFPHASLSSSVFLSVSLFLLHSLPPFRQSLHLSGPLERWFSWSAPWLIMCWFRIFDCRPYAAECSSMPLSWFISKALENTQPAASSMVSLLPQGRIQKWPPQVHALFHLTPMQTQSGGSTTLIIYNGLLSLYRWLELKGSIEICPRLDIQMTNSHCIWWESIHGSSWFSTFFFVFIHVLK